MDADFWHQLWNEKRLGFHQPKGNRMFAAQFSALSLAPGARVFLPLCGKTGDIAWLLDQGYQVAGAELSAIAITELFAELGVAPDITTRGALTHYSAPGLDIFVGDVFALDADTLGPVQATYDRAALVALPHDMRPAYAKHLAEITNGAPQLLITFEYDQTTMSGPPFSINADEVARVHSARYTLQHLAQGDVKGGLKGEIPAQEIAWLLQPTSP